MQGAGSSNLRFCSFSTGLRLEGLGFQTSSMGLADNKMIKGTELNTGIGSCQHVHLAVCGRCGMGNNKQVYVPLCCREALLRGCVRSKTGSSAALRFVSVASTHMA